MSEPISILITYRASFSRQSVGHLLDATRDAIAQNWLAHADSLSTKEPNLGLLSFDNGTIVNQTPEHYYSKDGFETSVRLATDFSPVSDETVGLVIWKYPDETIGISLD